jgi:hypothetical protein
LGAIDEFKRNFGERFSTKDLGEIKVLGIRITRDRKRRTIYLDQTTHLKQMLRQYDMDHRPGKMQTMKQVFGDIDEHRIAAQKIQKLRQHQSAREYITEF